MAITSSVLMGEQSNQSINQSENDALLNSCCFFPLQQMAYFVSLPASEILLLSCELFAMVVAYTFFPVIFLLLFFYYCNNFFLPKTYNDSKCLVMCSLVRQEGHNSTPDRVLGVCWLHAERVGKGLFDTVPTF